MATSRSSKSVLILYTGGTMGMRTGPDGGLSPQAGYLTEQIISLPEISRNEMPSFDIKEYIPLIDSSQMGPDNWAEIADDIGKNYFDYDGFVVIMGTDTMAYAASALSFMLENLGKTVVFTGSQIPFCHVYNDARRNLIVSIIFAANSDCSEVCICFNDKILRANRTMKVNSVGLDAFDSPNYPPIATIEASIRINRELCLRPPRGAFRLHKTLNSKVIVLKLVPGFDDSMIHALIAHSTELKAVVLEMYGTGNGPSSKESLLSAIKMAKEKGMVVVAISQCLRGGVALETYSMGREFQKAGVVSGGDMTTEACTTKLAYLFGTVSDPNIISQLVGRSIRGEISTASAAAGAHSSMSVSTIVDDDAVTIPHSRL